MAIKRDTNEDLNQHLMFGDIQLREFTDSSQAQALIMLQQWINTNPEKRFFHLYSSYDVSNESFTYLLLYTNE